MSGELAQACQEIREGYLAPRRFVVDLVAAADRGEVVLTGYWLDRARSILEPGRRQEGAPGGEGSSCR